MIDDVTPGFHRMSAQGYVINKPMDKINTQLAGAKAGQWEIRSGDSYWISDYVPDQAIALMMRDRNLSADLISREEDLAITSAYAEVGSPTYDLLSELVEAKETLSFLWSPVSGMLAATRRLRRYVNAFDRYEKILRDMKQRRIDGKRRKKYGKSWRHPKKPRFQWGKFHIDSIPSAWLAYRYAIMPLIYSFEDIQELAKKKEEGPQPRATARAKRSRSLDTVEITPWSPTVFGGATADYRYVARVKGELTVRAGVMYVPKWGLSHDLGATWHRIPRAYWEGIPLSFVSDWFHNGADVYDALTANLRAQEIEAAWVTTTAKWSVEVTCESKLTSSSGYVTPKVSYGSGVTEKKSRRPVSLADVRLRLKVDLGLHRIADALSLIKVILVTTRKN